MGVTSVMGEGVPASNDVLVPEPPQHLQSLLCHEWRGPLLQGSNREPIGYICIGSNREGIGMHVQDTYA